MGSVYVPCTAAPFLLHRRRVPRVSATQPFTDIIPRPCSHEAHATHALTECQGEGVLLTLVSIVSKVVPGITSSGPKTLCGSIEEIFSGAHRDPL